MTSSEVKPVPARQRALRAALWFAVLSVPAAVASYYRIFSVLPVGMTKAPNWRWCNSTCRAPALFGNFLSLRTGLLFLQLAASLRARSCGEPQRSAAHGRGDCSRLLARLRLDGAAADALAGGSDSRTYRRLSRVAVLRQRARPSAGVMPDAGAGARGERYSGRQSTAAEHFSRSRWREHSPPACCWSR